MPTATELLNRAANADSLGSVARSGIGGFFLAIASVLITGTLTIGQLITDPIQAMAAGASRLISALLTLPVDILEAAAAATARSLLGPWAVGPLTWAFGVASVLLGLLLINWYIGLEVTGNITGIVPFDVNWSVIPFIEGPEEEGRD